MGKVELSSLPWSALFHDANVKKVVDANFHFTCRALGLSLLLVYAQEIPASTAKQVCPHSWCSTSSVSRRIWSERARACSVVRRLCVNFLPSTLCLRRSVCRDSKAEGRPADARTASLTRPPALGIAVWCAARCAALATESTTTTRSRRFAPRAVVVL